MAYVNESVESIGFCAYEAIEDPKEPLRGATFVSEQFGCTRDVLNTDFGQKLKDKGICYIRCLTDKTQFGENMEGVYNHWQTWVLSINFQILALFRIDKLPHL